MKTEHRDVIKMKSPESGRLRVEIDTEAGAAYVRVRDGRIAKTVVQRDTGPIVTVDLDKDGNVLGIEFIGVKEFTIDSLLNSMPQSIRFPVSKRSPQYVTAKKASVEFSALKGAKTEA
jgi:uncharacterized protein YuzE